MIIDEAFALAVQGQVVRAAALARQGLDEAHPHAAATWPMWLQASAL